MNLSELFGDRNIEWQKNALCIYTDPDIFFPEKGIPILKEVKNLCARCPVKDQCLDYALSSDERHGIWGGTSERERKFLLKKQKHKEQV